jgi:hypothetical protein
MTRWDDPFWRTIEEPEEPVRVLKGLLATQPAAYERFWSRTGRETRADRALELLQRFASFAFSAIVHVLAVVLLAELVVIAAPIVEETILSAQLYRPSPKPDVPSPEPVSKPEEQKFERAAEAPRTAEEPQPPVIAPAPVVGSGSNEAAKPVAVGVLESVQELREEGLAHLTGTGIFENRGEGGRREAVGRYGGNEASEAAVELGLKWLAAHQSEDGRWSARDFAGRCPKDEPCGAPRGPAGFDHGVTGLALLAFLSAGYTHQKGAHQATVEKAIRWLVERQDAAGFFFDSSTGGRPAGGMYGHGVATFALGEAAAMTRDGSLLRPLEGAVRALEASQQPNGGWYYSVNPAERKSEFTLSVWQMMGLKAAEKAGVAVPAPVLERAKQHVRDSTAPSGGVYYSSRNNITLGSTGAGLFARCMFGMTQGDWLEKGLAYLEQAPEAEPRPGQHGWDYVYCWYYRTLAAFQVQGTAWRSWNARIRPFLVGAQKTRGHGAGSWAVIDYHQAGPVYSTAMCVLMLETYYRYLPMVSDRSGVLEGTAAALRVKDDPTIEELRRIEMLGVPLPGEVERRKRREADEARQRLKNDRSEDRYLGVRKLSELGVKEALPEMIAACEKETGRLKAVLVSYVGKLKSEEAVPYLMRLLDDADPLIRSTAMSALMNVTGVYIDEVSRWKDWYAEYQQREAPKK